MKAGGILFFADRLPPLAGGMEIHAGQFINHFQNHPRFPLSGVVTKEADGSDCLVRAGERRLVNLTQLSQLCSPRLLFFNSGRWIEELQTLRKLFPRALFLYRTGGNEILKAPLISQQLADHSARQSFWTRVINQTIDLLITNSMYTETRLRELGLTGPFVRCVGGVNTAALQGPKTAKQKPVTLFCAARFVPYKNHSLLLSVVRELVSRGHHLQLQLAGEGPLLSKAQAQVARDSLSSVVEFLGVLSNEETCRKIAQAHIYIQLSTDHLTEVPGGTYVHSEGMGRSILESLSAGTFVIAGRSGALPEIVAPPRGMVVELNAPKHIADRIEPIIAHPPTSQPLFEGYSWTHIFNRYEELFDAAL